MAKMTRRSLITKTGMGAAAAGVLVAGPAIVATKHHSTATSAQKLGPPKQIPTVAYVRDASKGEVVLMVGTREIVRKDLELVAYLGRCCDEGSV